MAYIDKTKQLKPSVLDRLIDHTPGVSGVTGHHDYQYLAELRESERRDLENLLNTRARMLAPGDDFPQLNNSLMNYGLPDLATINIFDKARLREFIGQLEQLLMDFEPRFKSVRVSPVENMSGSNSAVRLRIEAVMYADPKPQLVVFDSTLEPVTRSVRVRDAND